MEELMSNEIMETEAEENTDLVTVDGTEAYGVKDSGNGSAKMVVGLVCVAAGAGVALWKNRHKITDWADQRRIKKLQKHGFVVGEAENLEEDDVFVEEDSEKETEE